MTVADDLLAAEAPLDAAAYQELIAEAKAGECMVPEAFVFNADTTDLWSPGGIGNVASHFGHYADVARAIGEHDAVLDVGCGCGFGVRIYRLRTQGRVVAIDKRPAIDIARHLYPTPGVEYFEVDLREGELPEGPFDVVAMTDVYEHLDEETGTRVMEQVRECLTDDGRLIVSAPVACDSSPGVPNPYHLRTFPDSRAIVDELRSHLRLGQHVQFVRIGDIGMCGAGML